MYWSSEGCGESAAGWSVLIDFSLTVKAATLILISGCGSAISSTKEGKSGFIRVKETKSATMNIFRNFLFCF